MIQQLCGSNRFEFSVCGVIEPTTSGLTVIVLTNWTSLDSSEVLLFNAFPSFRLWVHVFLFLCLYSIHASPPTLVLLLPFHLLYPSFFFQAVSLILFPFSLKCLYSSAFPLSFSFSCLSVVIFQLFWKRTKFATVRHQCRQIWPTWPRW